MTDRLTEDLVEQSLSAMDQKLDELTARAAAVLNTTVGGPEDEAARREEDPKIERKEVTMTEENRREIRIPGGTVRLTEEAWQEQAPTPEMQERVRRDMERRQAIAEGEAKLRAEREAREREARFADDLERHVEDRRRFHALRGVPEAVFEAELLPEIERKFLKGEKDDVDAERERRASSVY